jgi:hypothetical protein
VERPTTEGRADEAMPVAVLRMGTRPAGAAVLATVATLAGNRLGLGLEPPLASPEGDATPLPFVSPSLTQSHTRAHPVPRAKYDRVHPIGFSDA